MDTPDKEGKRLIFRPWITVNGRKIHASQYGKRVFPIWVDREE